jgi:cell wall-associated NlpC family hydrolase
VKSGDSLWAIANRYNTTVAQLQRLNNITGSLIHPGQVVSVDGKTAQTTPASNTSTSSSATYTVKSGDSLWAIAVRYGSTVNKLMSLNNLKGTVIYPGQVLNINGGNTTGTSSRSGSSVTSSQRIIQTAYRFLGVPYVWGGMSPSGFDCSGFVKYVFSLNGITLPRVAADQANAGTKIWGMSQLQPGDLVCFSGSRNGYVSHIGIYVGGNQIINASSSYNRIAVESLSGSWYQQTFVCGVRVL